MDNYKSGLTLHGINWVYTSDNNLEKVFWALAMLASFGFALYMIKRYVERYLKFDVRTQIKYSESPVMFLPTLLVCLRSVLQGQACYRNTNILDGSTCNITKHENSSLTYHNFTTNQIGFARYIGHGCHVINENGSLTLGAAASFDLEFRVNSLDDSLIVYAFTSDDYRHRVEKLTYYDEGTSMVAPGKYYLSILETKKTRLRYPYVSNCTSKNLSPNLFSPRYSRVTCLQSCLIKKHLRECGDILDLYQQFKKDEIQQFVNITDTNRLKCFAMNYGKTDTVECDCPPPCFETYYETIAELIRQYNKNQWDITIYHRGIIKNVVEAPDYSIEDCFDSVGGILGLAIGASGLSVVELVVYFVLYVVHRIYQRL